MKENIPRSTLLYSSAAISAVGTAGYLLYRKIFGKDTPTEEDQIKHEVIIFSGLTITSTCALTSSVVHFAFNDDIEKLRSTGGIFFVSLGCMVVPAIISKSIEWYYRSDVPERPNTKTADWIKHALTNKYIWRGVCVIGALSFDSIFINAVSTKRAFIH
jgi:hypothetical protein